MAVWEVKYIQPNKYSRPQMKLNAVRKIVMHYTANPGATANGHYEYFNNLRGTYASAHFFVDKYRKLLIIPLNEVAYHANDVQQYVGGQPYRGVSALLPNANFLSIGIEMCIEKDGTFHPTTVKHAEEVALELCKKYKLDPKEDIVRHYDITHKICPKPWVDSYSGFSNFKNRLSSASKEKAKPRVFPSNVMGMITVLEDDLNVRDNASFESKVLATVDRGDTFKVYDKKNGLYNIGADHWVSAGEAYVEYQENPAYKPEPKVEPKKPQEKEEDDMLEKAVVYNSLADVAIAETLAKKLKTVTVSRYVAEKVQVAKELVVVGGKQDDLKADKFTVLSGKDRFETVAEVDKYMDKL
ncbi:N-acetylmuramoyl-L-alanine amidase [Halobacillus rhizosphaerae]|uniref:N-acetylmuramoyl-L-alanine amidase n=1 Tax=Halobacillus rhizosphaerae TaxID=3064889 RepID=UPI00398B2ED3